MYRNQNVIDEEVTFSDDEELVSVTDTRGVIRYVNSEFCRVSGFSENELTGKNHNIVRHPDMPKAAFADMWSKLQSGHAWRGAVKCWKCLVTFPTKSIYAKLCIFESAEQS